MEAFTLSSISQGGTSPSFTDDVKIQALAQGLEIENDMEKVQEIEHRRGDEYSYNGETYYIFTEEELDERRTNTAESLADDAECEIPEHLRGYFDRESYLGDTLENYDNESLFGYSNEIEIKIDGETFYIFQE